MLLPTALWLLHQGLRLPSSKSVNVYDPLLRVAPGVSSPGPTGTLKLTIVLWPTIQCSAYYFSVIRCLRIMRRSL